MVFVSFYIFVVMLFGCLVVKCGIDFASIFGPKNDQKSIQNWWKISSKNRSEKGSILRPILSPKSTKNGPKTGSQAKAILSRRRTRVRQPLTVVPAAPVCWEELGEKKRIDEWERRRERGKKRKDVPVEICHAWGPRPGELWCAWGHSGILRGTVRSFSFFRPFPNDLP